MIREKQLTPEQMREIFAKAESSDFLTGRKAGHDGTVFQASIDWILKNWAKVSEGNYDNREEPHGQDPSYDLDTYERDSIAKFAGKCPKLL